MNNSYLTKTESNRIKGLIVCAGYNIATLAEKMQMTRPTLSAKINGKVDFTKSEMESLANAISMKPEEIFLIVSCAQRNRRNTKEVMG